MKISTGTSLRWLTAGLLSLASASALAAADPTAAKGSGSASLSLSPIHFSVIDLTPADGIEAGFSLTRPWMSRHNMQSVIGGMTIASDELMPEANHNAHGNVGAAYFYDSVVDGHFTNGVSGSLAVSDSIQTGYWRSIDVILTPHSVLTVGGKYDFNTWTAGTLTNGSIEIELFSRNNTSQAYVSLDKTARGNFAATMVNNTDRAVEVSVYLESGAWMQGWQPIMAAVPEPGEYAMWLAGLGVLGALQRRRRTRL